MGEELLYTYNGLTRCNAFDAARRWAATWETQQACRLALKSTRREQCLYMRPADGTCRHPDATREACDDG